MNITKKIYLTLIILILLASASMFFLSKQQPSVEVVNPPTTTPTTKNFTEHNGAFSFDYNPLFTVTPGNDLPSNDWKFNLDFSQKGTLFATVLTPRDYMPKTNFSEAKLTIGKSSEATAIKSCLAENEATVGKPEATKVSGYPVMKFMLNDAAAGNYYDTTSYRGIIGGDCYAIEYTIHSTNIGNYSPDQGIKEFDKTKIVNELESIVKSLRLIVASN
ncbi:MAG: hypothetical protein WCI76_01680 [bacterium]